MTAHITATISNSSLGDRQSSCQKRGWKLRLKGHAWRFTSHWLTETLPQSQCLTFCSLTNQDPPETGEKQCPLRYLTNGFLPGVGDREYSI